MDKTLLDIISNFPAWRGDAYRLAMLIAEAQKEADKAALIAAGFTEASEIL